MPLTSLKQSPRVLSVPLAATTVAPVRTRVEPFAPGNLVGALAAGASLVFGASHPGRNDSARYLKFTVSGTDVAVADGVLAQVAAARDANLNVIDDLTITFGKSTGRLAVGQPVATPAATAPISAALLLECIVLVNGVPFGRISNANSPNPGAGQWGADADTDAGFTIVIGATTSAGLLKVGTEIEIIKPDTTYTALLAKRDDTGLVLGTALSSGVMESRYLGAPVSVTDPNGRTAYRLASSDFLAADVAAAALFSITK